MSRQYSLAAFWLIAVAACGGDSTGPLASTQIAISVASLEGPTFLGNADEPRVQCNVTLRAQASGTGRAVWQDATVRFFVGTNRETPVDSVIVPASGIHAAWHGEELEAGQSAESQWVVESSAPFEVSADFRYTNRGTSVQKATVQFRCGPDVAPNAAPPVITELSVTPPADGLEPGDELLVTYAARSDVGLMSTAVELTGPCQGRVEFIERLQPSVSRTVSIPIPRTCQQGVPVIVNIYVADAGLRFVSRGISGPPVVDHTPPSIQVIVLGPDGLQVPTVVVFAGDSIALAVNANDNSGVRTIVYELLPTGRRDSVTVASTFQGIIRVPVPADVTGFVQVRLLARDVSGITSDPLLTAPTAIRAYPTLERPTMTSPMFDGGVRDFVIDDARGAIYVIPWNRSRITVVSTATLQVTRTIALPYQPISVDFTPGGDSLLVTGGPALTVVDLRPPTPVLSEIPLTLDPSLNQHPVRVVVLGNGRAYVTTNGNSPPSQQILEIDLATGQSRTRPEGADVDGVTAAGIPQRSSDRTVFVYRARTGHFRRYEAATDRFTTGATVTPYNTLFSLDRGGVHTAWSLDIYDATLNFVRRVESPFGPFLPVSAASALAADGEYLYHMGAPGIMRSRVSDGALVDRTRNSIAANMIRVASDGTYLVTGLGFELGVLSLIRLQ